MAAVAINLLAAGGIGIPTVALGLWSLIALGLNLREDRPCGQLRVLESRVPAFTGAAAWAAILGVFLGAVVPFWRTEAAIAEGEEAIGRQPPDFERAERALGTARNQVAYTELRANETGIITALPVEMGQVVAVGQLVARLAQLSEREVVVAIPESRLDDARASDATVDLWADGSRSYQAVLREFSPQADPITRTYQARFTIEAADDAVALGMTATVRLVLKEGRAVVQLPLGAIYNDGLGPSVFIVTPDGAHLRRAFVNVLEYRQDDVVIAGGLSAGDRVVALGAQLLDENKPIRVVEERRPPSP